MVVLAILIVLTPLTVGRVPEAVSAALLFLTIALLLVSGQTIIFLLRLVSADRRGRRAPLAARSPTVGQLEDAETAENAEPAETAAHAPGEPAAAPGGSSAAPDPPPGETVADAPGSFEPPAAADPPGSGPVRQ